MSTFRENNRLSISRDKNLKNESKFYETNWSFSSFPICGNKTRAAKFSKRSAILFSRDFQEVTMQFLFFLEVEKKFF